MSGLGSTVTTPLSHKGKNEEDGDSSSRNTEIKGPGKDTKFSLKEAVTADSTREGGQGGDKPLRKIAHNTKDEKIVKKETPSVMGMPKMEKPSGASKDQEPSSGPEADDDVSKADEHSVGEGMHDDGEKTDDAMDTEDQHMNRADAAEDASTSSKADLPYSTRGRSTGSEPAGSGAESWDRGTLETLEEIGRTKEHTTPATLGASFLESLSEEERRTRTRFLPDVEGMHTLRKAEIKDDLALARSLVSASGLTSLKKSKGKRSRNEDDEMEADDEDGASPSEDDRSSDNGKGSAIIEFRLRDLVLPSNAFLAPPGGTQTTSSEENSDDHEGQNSSSGGHKALLQSPSVVESVTAFNPPRPPESIGAKKRHRMLRWERRPEDVEVDLNNYRKTVQRTRQELHSAEAEYNRLETVDAHLRWNFLHHLNLLNEEYLRLNEEFSSVQQECVKAADLLTSRTRSRGAGKGSYVMRDVLSVLKARGAETKDNDGMDVDTSRVSLGSTINAGIGGLSSLAFSDWSRSTKITPLPPASSWIVCGEKVTTPYGEGVVKEIQPGLEIHEPNASNKRSKRTVEDVKSSDSASGKSSEGLRGTKRKKDSLKPEKKEQNAGPRVDATNSNTPTRVTVEFGHGTGHFSLDAVAPVENPAVLSDAKLAKRWKSMIDSALSVGGCLDIQGMYTMRPKETNNKLDSDTSDIDDSSQGRVDDSHEDPENNLKSDSGAVGSSAKRSEERVLPFGSAMLPTSNGRGSALQNLSIHDIEAGTNQALFSGYGVLGTKTHQGVTEDFRKWEDDETEYLTLQASVLQLKNALVRQKRIRLLNERTSVVTTDRYHRAEELVSEMRADLKSLKQRLEQELQELGIDETTAEQILSSYYHYNVEDEDEDDGMDLSPQKQRNVGRDEDGTREERFADAHYRGGINRGSLGSTGAGDTPNIEREPHKPVKKMRPNQ